MNVAKIVHNVPLHRQDGTFAIWDHPQFYTQAILPEKFNPGIGLDKVLSLYYDWPESRRLERLTILKVIGDSVCANEAQIRRYLSSVFSPSLTSENINFLRRHGFIQRYRCYIEGHNDEEGNQLKINVAAPLNLGIAGYTLLRFLYSDHFFMNPNAWLEQNSSAMIQRFVAMNEVRCNSVELGLAKGWKWYPTFSNSPRIKKPLAMMQIGEINAEADERAWLLFERAQSSQNFIGFLKDRLNLYRHLYELENAIEINGLPTDAEKIIVISCPTVRMGELIQDEIGLQKFPFEVWLLIDEWFDQEGAGPMNEAFAKPFKNEKGYELTRIKIPV